MKATELREMTDVELNKQLKDLKAELFNLRFQHAINQLDNPIRIENVKKDIARVMTVLAEKNAGERLREGKAWNVICERPVWASLSPTRWTRPSLSLLRTASSTLCTRRS